MSGIDRSAKDETLDKEDAVERELLEVYRIDPAAPPREVDAATLREAAELFGSGTPPAGTPVTELAQLSGRGTRETEPDGRFEVMPGMMDREGAFPVGSNRVTQDTQPVTRLVEWIEKRNLVKEARARLSHMSQDQVLAALESLRTYPDQTLNRAGGDPGFTPEMAQLHMVLVGVKGDEERSEAKLARRAENKRLVEKARELLGLAISLDTALETETSRKLFNTARVILRNLDVAP